MKVAAAPDGAHVRRRHELAADSGGERVLQLHQPRVGGGVVAARLGQLGGDLVLQLLGLGLLGDRVRLLLGELIGLLLEVGTLLLQLRGLRVQGVCLLLQARGLPLQRRGLRGEGVGLAREVSGLPTQGDSLATQRRRTTRQRDCPLADGAQPGPGRGDASLHDGQRVDLGGPLGQQGGLLLGRCGGDLAVQGADVRPQCDAALVQPGQRPDQAARLPSQRLSGPQQGRALCPQRGCLLPKHRRLGCQPCGLPLQGLLLVLEARRLGRQLSPLFLQGRLLLLERCLLRLQSVRLVGQIGLLLGQRVLHRGGLRILGGVLRTRRRLGLECDGDDQRTVVAGPETGREQVESLALGGVLRCDADVLLAEDEAEHRDRERHQDGEGGDDRHPLVAR